MAGVCPKVGTSQNRAGASMPESCQALNFGGDPFIPVNIERMRAVVLCLAPEAEKFL